MKAIISLIDRAKAGDLSAVTVPSGIMQRMQWTGRVNRSRDRPRVVSLEILERVEYAASR